MKAGGLKGQSFFVYPTDGTVYAPEDGTVTFVFDTKHAIGMALQIHEGKACEVWYKDIEIEEIK